MVTHSSTVDNRGRTVSRALAALLIGVFCCCGVASATESLMDDQLPAYDNSRFGCLICHNSATPAQDSSLNVFGDASVANGLVWNSTLAAGNADGDDCSNGAELGDVDGDGQLDGNTTEENGNPGVEDSCAGHALTEAATWGALKNLFQ